MINTLFVHTSVVVFGFLMVGDYCKNHFQEKNVDQRRKELEECFQKTSNSSEPMPRIADWKIQQIIPCEKQYMSYLKVAIR
jgi:hypothetical protein